MPEAQFWATTPRKLKALVDVYLEIQDAKAGKESNEKPKMVYIDQITL